MTAQDVVGIITILAGLFFAFFGGKISKGAAELYRKFYTAKNLRVMFIFVGLFLILIGIIILIKR